MTLRPLVISVLLHVFFVVLVLVGLPSIKRDLPEEMPIIRMEVVQSLPETNLIEGDKVSTAKQAQEPAKTKRKPPPPPPPAPPPKRAEPAPSVETAEVIEPQPDPSAEILPEKPVAKPEITKAKSPALPKQLPKSKPKRPPKPAAKPKAKPKKDAAKDAARQAARKSQEDLARTVNKLANDKKKRQQAGEAALQNLAKLQQQAKDAEEKRKAKQRKEAADKIKNTVTATAGNAVKARVADPDKKVGIDDITRISQHISKCWKPPLGAAGNDSLIVDIIVSLDRDGTVLEATIKDRGRYGRDSYFKAAADEAQRATIECSPLPIPADKYEQMKLLELGLNPEFLSR